MNDYFVKLVPLKQNRSPGQRLPTLTGMFFLLILLHAPVSALALTGKSTTDNPFSPLRPPDTGSPRDTLRSFMDNTAQITTHWRQGEFSRQTAQAYLRAMETLDLSSTPHSNAWGVRTTRVLLLDEILRRIPIPDFDAIPGHEAITRKVLSQWRIPGTRLVIARIERGSRKGEYLFSAATVQQLDRIYRHIQDMPYQPDISPGIYHAWNASEGTKFDRYHQIRNRLIPVDTSSPRSTLEDFLDSVNRAYEVLTNADAALRADPPTMTHREAMDVERDALYLLQRAAATLDLTKIATAHRQDTGLEAVLQLKEIFDRMMLPPIDSIPSLQMVNATREQMNNLAILHARPFRWRYPNTEIEIAEITQGEKQGQFLFSADTVTHLRKFYRKVSDLPYRQGVESLDYKSPGKSEGFYQRYISTPGYMIQQIHFLGVLVDALPDGFKSVYLGQTGWQWLGILVCIMAAILLSYWSCRIIYRLSKTLVRPWQGWLVITAPLLISGIILVLLDFIDEDLNMTGNVLTVTLTSGNALIYLMLSWAAFKAVVAGVDTVIALPQVPEEGIDASLLRLSARIIGAVIGIWVIIHGMHRLGVDIIPLLAGLGIGGLTVALAARPTLANIIGSFMIFADHPYKVGQRIKVSGQDGIVESIGLRSTRIRLLNGHLSTIPNEKMAGAEVENIGERPFIRRTFNLALPYNTPPGKISEAIETVKKILSTEVSKPIESYDSSEEPHPNDSINRPALPPRVYCSDFTSLGINIEVHYWYHPPNYWAYLAHADWINRQIITLFNEAGIEFALPERNLHFSTTDKSASGLAPFTTDR